MPEDSALVPRKAKRTGAAKYAKKYFKKMLDYGIPLTRYGAVPAFAIYAYYFTTPKPDLLDLFNPLF